MPLVPVAPRRNFAMPLLDHFVPPLSLTHPWRGFPSAWAAAMAQHLNRGILPPRFYALPNVTLGGPVEIDVAALRDESLPEADRAEEAVASWSASEAAVAVAVDFAGL